MSARASTVRQRPFERDDRLTPAEITALMSKCSPACQSNLAALSERRRLNLLALLKEYLAEEKNQRDGASATPSTVHTHKFNSKKAGDDDTSLMVLFETKVEAEVESQKRIRALAEKLRKDDISARWIALVLTLCVAVGTIGVAIFLAEGRRVNDMFDMLTEMWYWIAYTKPGQGTFTVDGEEYDLYS